MAKHFVRPSNHPEPEGRLVFIASFVQDVEADCVIPKDKRRCPKCRNVLNVAAGELPFQPRPCDLHICFYCRSILIIANNCFIVADAEVIAEETLAISKVQNIIRRSGDNLTLIKNG